MEYEYDPEADAIYIHLSDKVYAYGEDLDRKRRLDYAADGTPIGVELLCIRSGTTLHDLPYQDLIEKTLRQLSIKVFA
ncbi:MAG: hypothetical protein DDT36_01728 [Firmicutes bacterium]|nr:hypothetical protein [Bacillota bacterium]MBT9158710.1 hypothetical protein [Bacillota bacterium]